MRQTIAGIERKGRAQLAEVLRVGGPAITVRNASDCLHLPGIQVAKLMARWAQQGWLVRLRRGLYASVPIQAKSAEDAVEDPWVVAANVFKPCYIGGWSAAEHWGFTEQIFRTVVVITKRPVAQRRLKIQSTEYWAKTPVERRFFGTKTVWRGKTPIAVSDPTKTIVDMLNDPAMGGGARMVTDVLSAYLSSEYKNLEQLLDYARRMDNGAIFKRLGYLLETTQAAADKKYLTSIKKYLTAGNAKLDPALPGQRLITRWRLWVPAAEGRIR